MMISMTNLLDAPGAATVRVIFLVALAAATVTDLRQRRIPNLLTLPLALVAMVTHGIYGGIGAALASLLAFLSWFALGYIYYRSIAGREIGAGDIKLIMAMASCLGFMPAAYITFVSLVLLILWLFLRWLVQGTARANFAGLRAWLYSTATPGTERIHFRPVGMVDRTPHAPFMLLSALICYFWWHFLHLGA